MKKKKIKERLESIDKALAHAEAYVEKGTNVRSPSPLHHLKTGMAEVAIPFG